MAHATDSRPRRWAAAVSLGGLAAAAATLLCARAPLGGAAAAPAALAPPGLAAAGPAARALPTCLLQCPTAPPPTATGGGTPPPTPPPPTAPPTEPPTPGGAPASGGPGGPTPVVLSPPPTLPPGGPPAAAGPAVQRITLVRTSGGAAPPAGVPVEVEVTLEAMRGSDLYAVPHAPLTLAVSGPGQGAAVTPSSGDGGDTGVVVAEVRTGDSAGENVLRASSGPTVATLRIVTTAPVAGAGGAAAVPVDAGGSGDAHGALVAVLAGVVAAVAAGGLAHWTVLPRLRERRLRRA